MFVMLEITPGDPARQLAGADASEEAVEQLREQMGLNDPAITRFVRYIWNACHGDLGASYTTKAPVIHEIMNRFPTTFTLACLSTLIAGCTGILLGIISATHQYSFLDRFATVFALLGVSMPVFWLGMLLIVFFSVNGAGLGGAVVTETVFSIPGLGKLMVDSINSRNYPMVQGGVLIIACVFTLVNLAVDVIYAYLDPRIKSQYGGRVKAKKLVKTKGTEKGGGQE